MFETPAIKILELRGTRGYNGDWISHQPTAGRLGELVRVWCALVTAILMPLRYIEYS